MSHHSPKPQNFNSTRLSHSNQTNSSKLSSISTISQRSIYKTPKTKIKLPQDSFSNSPKTSLQRFFVSSFLREFSESLTKIHVSSFRGAVRWRVKVARLSCLSGPFKN